MGCWLTDGVWFDEFIGTLSEGTNPEESASKSHGERHTEPRVVVTVCGAATVSRLLAIAYDITR